MQAVVGMMTAQKVMVDQATLPLHMCRYAVSPLRATSTAPRCAQGHTAGTEAGRAQALAAGPAAAAGSMQAGKALQHPSSPQQ